MQDQVQTQDILPKEEKQMEEKDVILVRMGEIALKGLNRRKFEQKLIKNIKYKIEHLFSFKIYQSQSRIWIEPKESVSLKQLQKALSLILDVFGLVSVSIVRQFQVDMEILKHQLAIYLPTVVDTKKAIRFKVETRRGNKQFPIQSQELSAIVGGYILSHFPKLTVDVHEPDFILHLEVREHMSIYVTAKQGLRGLPVGISGKSLLLLSGGIDSPVAGFLMASRGLKVEAIYFHTFPYTSDRAKEKVITLARKLSRYVGRFKLHVVDFTDVQLELNELCKADLMTIVMRRLMLKIAEKKAYETHCQGLITGESMGQVASQTLEAISVTDNAVQMPIFRPLIGMDKEETVQIAKKIDTFETSILPYEDCCTVFVAKHPKTKPKLTEVLDMERLMPIEDWINRQLEKIETIVIEEKEGITDEF